MKGKKAFDQYFADWTVMTDADLREALRYADQKSLCGAAMGIAEHIELRAGSSSKARDGRKAEVAALNAASMDGTLHDELNPLFIFGMTHNDLLLAIATGKIDAVQLAKEQLAGRGFGKTGTWVGFDRADAEWGI